MRFKIIATLSIIGICLMAVLGAAPQKSAGIQGRALIIGIDHYKDPLVAETPGSVSDAKSLAQFVQSKYGFAPESVKVLLNEQATAENIDHWFVEWLIKGTKPGERVFFSYAGHGSQLPELRKGNEKDGLDETIAPYDVNPLTGENEIRDDHFEELISQLSGRMAVLLFDSCHSGTISRGIPPSGPLRRFIRGGGVRYLPSPAQFKALTAVGTSRGVGDGYVVEGSSSRDILPPPFIKPQKIAGLSGVVVISATRDDQRAYPIEVDGELRGALSFLFQESQADSNGHSSLQAIKRYITQKMAELLQQGKLKNRQDPQFEVISTVPLDNEPIFGSNAVVPQVALSNPLSSIKLSIKTLEGRSTYKIGETVSYEVKTDTPGYLYLVVFSEKRVATCIFPYRDERGEPENNYVSNAVRLPLVSGGYPIQEPIGRDIVVTLLSPTRLNLGERVNGEYTWDEVFERLNQRQLQDAIGNAARRGVGIRPGSGQGLQGANWQAATIILESTR